MICHHISVVGLVISSTEILPIWNESEVFEFDPLPSIRVSELAVSMVLTLKEIKCLMADIYSSQKEQIC